MKKIIGLALCLMLIVPAAFAGDFSVKGYLTQFVTLGSEDLNSEKGSGTDDAYAFGKSRLQMTYMNDNIKGYIELDASTGANGIPGYKYAWAESKALGGTLRVGLLALAAGNWGGGLSATSTFWGYANVYGNGLMYTTTLFGQKVTFANTDAFLPDGPKNATRTNSEYAMKMNRTCMGVDMGLLVKSVNNQDVGGLAFALEASKAFGPLLAQAQYYAEDKEVDAALGARTITAAYLTYDLGFGDVYLTHNMTGTTTEAKKTTATEIGMDYTVEKNLILNVGATMASAYNEADTDSTTFMGLQANF